MMFCHPERSEGSLPCGVEILRFAQNDNEGNHITEFMHSQKRTWGVLLTPVRRPE
jgi:hypothetical protein